MIFSEIFISTKGMPSHFMMTQYGSKWRGGAKQKVHPVGLKFQVLALIYNFEGTGDPRRHWKLKTVPNGSSVLYAQLPTNSSTK